MIWSTFSFPYDRAYTILQFEKLLCKIMKKYREAIIGFSWKAVLQTVYYKRDLSANYEFWLVSFPLCQMDEYSVFLSGAFVPILALGCSAGDPAAQVLPAGASCPALMLWLSYDNETKVLWTIDWMLKLQEEEMVWLGPPHTPFTCLEIAASFLSAQSCEPKKPPNIQITSQPEFYYTVARNLMYCIFPKPSSWV